ncbi:MAG TPA: response regulator [Bacteroidetes bacterium]|nr:response regulator [Bacteroidota bacterium]HIL57352.1 response regulator [Rhodothermales bacterium]
MTGSSTGETVVRSLPIPALLFGLDLGIVARSVHWASPPELFEGFATLKAAAQDALQSERSCLASTGSLSGAPRRMSWSLRPLWNEREVIGALAVSLSGVPADALPAEAPPPAALYTARSHLTALVGHLEVLRRDGLTRVQQARLDCCLEEAIAIDAALSSQEAGLPGAMSYAGALPLHATADPYRILVIDDNETNRQVTLSMLQVLGHHAVAAASGAEGLEALAAAPFDIVLLDVMMPGMDGAEVAQQIRAMDEEPPRVIGLSALPQARDRCLAAGMEAFLVKPVRLRQLAAALAPLPAD